MARANPVRFSTKYQDDETDLLYYGYRYYTASTGRWLSRDPLGESGSMLSGSSADLADEFEEGNLLRFVANNPVSSLDFLGLSGVPSGKPKSSCSCTCRSLKVTFVPGGTKFDPGFHVIGGESRFGAVIIAAWTLEEGSDPTKCHYFAKEPDGGLTKMKGPKGTKPDTKGTPGQDWAPVPQVWYDATGFDMEGPGDYRIKYNLTQTYKCVSADGVEKIEGPKHYKKTVKKQWPER